MKIIGVTKLVTGEGKNCGKVTDLHLILSISQISKPRRDYSSKLNRAHVYNQYLNVGFSSSSRGVSSKKMGCHRAIFLILVKLI